MTNSDAGGCVAGSQPKVLAIRKADGTYELRHGTTMRPLPTWRVVLDENAAILYSNEPALGPHIPSKIQAALARLKARSFDAALEREQRNFGAETAEGLPPDVVDRIRKTIYDDA